MRPKAEAPSSGWHELQIRVAPPMKDAIVHQLFEWGAKGVIEDDAEDECLIRAFFEEVRREEVAEALQPFLNSIVGHFPGTGATTVSWSEVEDEDWSQFHKQFYPAQSLTHLFFLKPAWDEQTEVPDGMVPLILEPGQAFGTGLHASTRLCMRMLEYCVEMHPRPHEIRALDVGTGTGILAMALSKLGIHEAIATDHDPIALEVAAENFGANACNNIELTDSSLDELEGEFEIIVSNILLETHRELATQYRRLIAPRGQIILSGLLVNQRSEIEELMAQAGFQVEGSETSQEWLALAFTPMADLHSS